MRSIKSTMQEETSTDSHCFAVGAEIAASLA